MTSTVITQYEKLVAEYLEKNPWINNPKEINDPIIDYMADMIIQRAKDEEQEITKFMHFFEEFGQIYLIELYNRFKGKPRLEEKIQQCFLDGMSVNEVMHNIRDSLRYTFIIQDDNYVEKVQEILHGIEERYTLNTFKNCWAKPYYKGLNCSFMLENGFLFEVQFHTPMSYTIKEGKLRDVYNIIRNPKSDSLMVDICNAIRLYYQSFVKIPDNAIDFQYEAKKQVK